MNNAKLATSPRLKRVAGLLATGHAYSTMEIVDLAKVCAVNSIISELRANGLAIDCGQYTVGGRRIWLYRMVGQRELFAT